MPTAYSYIRFSSAQQAFGDSKRRQQEAVSAWLIANPDYEQSDLSFEDLGVSGFKGKHLESGFGKLRAAIEAGSIKPGSAVLIEAIDRAGRLNPSEMLNILTEIVNAGVNLITLDDGVVYDNKASNANNLFLLVAKVQQAHQYSDALSQRIKAAYKGKREKAAKGETIRRRTPVWLTTDGELISDVAPFIVEAFELYAAGLGERRIHHRIMGKHPLLDKLSPGTIKKWFRNPTAIGRWQEIDDVYPAVVSKELYYRVQQRLVDVYKPKAAAQKYLLTGLVRCGVCGNNMGVQSFGERSPAIMQCTKRTRLGALGCSNNKSMPYRILEYILTEHYQPFLRQAVISQRLTTGEKRIIEIEGELKELHRRTESLAQAIAEHGYIPALSTQLALIGEEIRSLEIEKLSIPKHVRTDDEGLDLVTFDLLVQDEIKLNALLQGVSFEIICTGKTITVPDATPEDATEAHSTDAQPKGHPNVHEYVYNGVQREPGASRTKGSTLQDRYVITSEEKGRIELLVRGPMSARNRMMFRMLRDAEVRTENLLSETQQD